MTAAPRADHRHSVHFYADDVAHMREIAGFLAASLDQGGGALLVATPSHAAGVTELLAGRGVAVADVRARGLLREVDAADMLGRIRPAGRLDRERFFAEADGLLAGLPDLVHAYGEMVALLWEQDDTAGALELEVAWNELLRHRTISLLCGYPGRVIKAGHGDLVAQVNALHTHAHPDTQTHASPTAPGRVPVELHCPLPPTAEAPRLARRAALRLLAAHADMPASADAALVVSELVTNAVLHGVEPMEMAVAVEPDGVLRIAVSDGSPELEAGPARSLTAATGRGLALVAALARRWGVRRGDAGKTVWAELPVSAGS